MFTPFRLKKPIGEEFNMDLEDTLNTKKALLDLGLLEVPGYGIDEYPDRSMLDGVKSFQREQGLKVDGVMKPNGPTIKRLNETLAEIRQAPQPHPSKAAHLGGYTSQTIPPFQREQGPIVDGEAQPRQEAKNELNNKIFIQKK